jgi:aminoglycoside/choline kinase family phosphotransferase
MSGPVRESEATADSDTRLALLEGWLTHRLGLRGAEVAPLAADASFRRYFRVRLADGGTRVVMDAPPAQEDVGAFARIARLLHDLDLSAPEILAEDRADGLLLLEDLGDLSYTRALAEGADETALYTLATDTLLALHERFEANAARDLPAYDLAALLDEAELLLDWYWPAVLGGPCPEDVRAQFRAAWGEVLEPALADARTLVLRDYHVDNLIWLRERAGVGACGLLDFQDAVLGPPAYDLVSLLRDARRDVPPALQTQMFERYLAARPGLDPAAFAARYWALGAQRTTKVIGIFTRLARRDAKPAYLRHLPRLWGLLETELAQPELGPVRAWYAEHLPPAQRRPDPCGP